jgi:YD repeat-containing protein
MKKLVSSLLMLGLFWSFTAFAQETTDVPNMQEISVIPPSPNVSAFNKVVDVPISFYTGTPQITIPLAEVKLNQITIPVALSYNASGLKVEEHASWVGAGWTLNASGIISRTVRGLPDEIMDGGKQGYFTTMAKYAFTSSGHPNNTKLTDCTNYNSDGSIDNMTYTSNEDPINYLDSLERSVIDTQPDLYYYNFPGASGKFVFNQSQRLIKYKVDDISIYNHPYIGTITPDLSAQGDYLWQIQHDNGIIYTFNRAEGTQVSAVCGMARSPYDNLSIYQSAWHLSEIQAKEEWVHFNYESESITYIQSYIESKQIKVDGLGDQNKDSYCNNSTTTNAKRLQSIVSSKGDSVAFIADTARLDLGGKRLDKIQIYKNNILVKAYSFTYEYFGSNTKLKLTSVKEIGVIESPESSGNYIEGPALNPHSFEYFTGASIPTIDSKSQDAWGYFNGAANTYSIVPEYKDEYHHVNRETAANRMPDLFYAKIGTLKKVTYPTKGYAVFDYELHDYYTQNEPVTYEYSVYASGGSLSDVKIHTTTFTVNQNCSATLVTDALSDGISDGSYAELRKWDGSAYVKEDLQAVVGGNRYQLPAGQYQLYAQNDGSESNNSLKIIFEQPENVDKQVGGLRVKKTVLYDAVDPKNQLIKTYSYKLSSTGNSSGVLFSPLSFGGYKTTIESGTSCSVEGTGTYINLNSYSQVPLAVYEGSHIGYSEVKVIQEKVGSLFSEELDNGYTIYTFINEPAPYVRGYPYVPTPYLGHKNGRQTSETIYKAVPSGLYQKVMEKFNEYTEVAEASLFVKGFNFKRIISRICYSCYASDFGYNEYAVQPVWYYLSKSVENHYDDSETIAFSNTTDYYYSSVNHKKLTKKVSSNSKGQRFRTEYRRHTYPALIKEKKVFNDGTNEQIEGQAFAYYGVLPESVAVWDRQDGMYHTKRSISYNTQANISAITDYAVEQNVNELPKTGLKQHFIWGYNHSYPIAKIEGTTLADFAFSGFENNEAGNWTTSTGEIISLYNSHTGKSIFQGQLEKVVSSTGVYEIALWAKTNGSGSVSVNGIAQTVSGTWRLYRWTVENPSTVVVKTSDTSTFIDDVAMYPVGAHVTTFTFREGIGIASQSDPNGMVTTYEYDAFGRLKIVRDPDGNILQEYSYTYMQ